MRLIDVLILAVFSLISVEVMASGSVTIDGKLLKDKEHMNADISKQLNLPHFNGKNSESLYEQLSTDYSGYNIIKIKNLNRLKAKLGSEYIEGVVQSIIDASEDNNKVVLLLE